MPIADDYKTVPERIADFKAKHPEGCLRPADPARPFEVVEVAGKTFIVYIAAAFRSPDDPCPGVGAAWEPFPGPTNFTRDSELQNAETSAWGRAIVAVLASESKNIASADEVRNRQAGNEHAEKAQPQRPVCPVCKEPLTGKAVRAPDGSYLHEKCANEPAEETP